MDNIEYKEYEQICDELYEKVPFAVINDKYRPNVKKAYFYFWDSDYIPPEMMKYRLQPPAEPEFDFSHINLPPSQKEQLEVTLDKSIDEFDKSIDKLQEEE